MFRRLWYEPLEAKDVKGFVHDLHFLLIIDRVNLHLAQAARWVICKNLIIRCFKIPPKNLKEIKRFKIPKNKSLTGWVISKKSSVSAQVTI